MKPLVFLRRLKQAYSQWQDDDGSLMAAAVAYYAALSFFPLLLVLLSGLGMVFAYTEWGQDAQQQIVAAIGQYTSPTMRESVVGLLGSVKQEAAVGGPLGILGLLFTAGALFVHFETAFDRIWNVDKPGPRGWINTIRSLLFQRLRAFLMLLAVGILVLVVFVAGAAMATVHDYAVKVLPIGETGWTLMTVGVSLVLNTGLFTLVYRWLPKVRIHWSEAARGGLLAAILWEVGRFALASFVVGEKFSPYGLVGSFIAVMLWIYYAAVVIFLAAEYVQVICRECNPPGAEMRER